MLRSMNELKEYAIHATDGTIGHVKDFYFDDEKWVVRYLIADTGSWLLSRRVLISPLAIGHPDRNEKILPVSLTKEQVKNSPDIDTEKPVSRQMEIRYLGYYGYPYYWGSVGLWGAEAYPGMMLPPFSDMTPIPDTGQKQEEEKFYAPGELAQQENDDPHLRSCEAIKNYHIHASDGDIGHVDGFLIDEETWAIRYMIVNTSNWWLGHQVLIAPQWIQEMSWPEATVSVNLSRQAVQTAPRYDPEVPLDRAQEMRIHEHYEQPGYWEDLGR